MNELKPVAWMFQHEETGVVSIVDIQQVEWGFEKNNPRLLKVGPLYIIPDTHRVVSAEFLKVVEMIVTEARDYYSDMNDNVCQSYADPWEHAADVCIELRAIIDNKEQS